MKAWEAFALPLGHTRLQTFAIIGQTKAECKEKERHHDRPFYLLWMRGWLLFEGADAAYRGSAIGTGSFRDRFPIFCSPLNRVFHNLLCLAFHTIRFDRHDPILSLHFRKFLFSALLPFWQFLIASPSFYYIFFFQMVSFY